MAPYGDSACGNTRSEAPERRKSRHSINSSGEVIHEARYEQHTLSITVNPYVVRLLSSLSRDMLPSTFGAFYYSVQGNTLEVTRREHPNRHKPAEGIKPWMNPAIYTQLSQLLDTQFHHNGLHHEHLSTLDPMNYCDMTDSYRR